MEFLTSAKRENWSGSDSYTSSPSHAPNPSSNAFRMPYIGFMASFKVWLMGEGRDLFGFERRSGSGPATSEKKDHGPIKCINSDAIVEFLVSNKVLESRPVSDFSNQVRWGEGPGAVKMVISPLGSYKSVIRRLQTDLEGGEVWACKRVLPYREMLSADMVMNERIGWTILEEVERIKKQNIEVPSGNYDGLERLVHKASRAFQRKGVMPEIFIYRGVRELEKARNYLIVFEVRGQGVEAPGSARVEQFVVNMSYSPKTGMIRSFGHDVESPTKGHRWYPQPSEWDEYFSAGQDEAEIIDCVGRALSTY